MNILPSRLAILTLATALLAACATSPQPLQGQFSALTPRQATDRFPRVAADVVYLWPIRERVNVITRPEPWPWWGWW
jgi:starvation-inducible outer membrane lipoprotein